MSRRTFPSSLGFSRRSRRVQSVGAVPTPVPGWFLEENRRALVLAVAGAWLAVLVVVFGMIAHPQALERTPPVRTAEETQARADDEITRGRELFVREWMPGDSRSHGGDGLGPVFNDSSCVACHNQGGTGGGGPNSKNVNIITLSPDPMARFMGGMIPGDLGEAENRRRVHPGLTFQASVVLHHSGVSDAYAPWRLERLKPPEGGQGSLHEKRELAGVPDVWAKVEIERTRLPAVTSTRSGSRQVPGRAPQNDRLIRSQRNPTPLFGAGLIDAIPDVVIWQAANRVYPEFPEVRGRISNLGAWRVGRFGWKAQLTSLEEFVMTACAVELGLEVPGHPQGGDPLTRDVLAPGLDLVKSECSDLVAYVRSLPGPVQRSPSSLAEARALESGRTAFLAIGCGTCHTPDLGSVVGIYSDLLLHDMGSEASDPGGSYGMFQSDPFRVGPNSEGRLVLNSPGRVAEPGEWRTPPLWGVRDSAPYLHDGRADTLEQAIALHGGQGSASALRFFDLATRRRQQVLAFLKSLAAPLDAPAVEK